MSETSEQLLDRLIEAARQHKMTPAEHFEQRVSFVWGQMNGAMTKDEVREKLREMHGYAPAQPPGAET